MMPDPAKPFSMPPETGAPGTYGPAFQPKPIAVQPPADLLKAPMTPLIPPAQINKALTPKKPQSIVGQTTQELPGAAPTKKVDPVVKKSALDAIRLVLGTFDEQRKQAALGESFGLVKYTQHWLRGRQRMKAAECNAVSNFVRMRVR
jgi:hypothetical protein